MTKPNIPTTTTANKPNIMDNFNATTMSRVPTLMRYWVACKPLVKLKVSTLTHSVTLLWFEPTL